MSSQSFPIVKVEEGPSEHQPFPEGTPDDDQKVPKVNHHLFQATRRVSYSESSHCPPVMLICRVLEPTN